MNWPRFVLAVLFLSLPALAQAGPGGCGNGPSLTAIDAEQITVSSTAVGFTVSKFTRNSRIPVLAVVAVQTNAIRSLDNGALPTATVGMPWAAASTFSVCGEANIRALRMIRQSADATVDVTYYAEGN